MYSAGLLSNATSTVVDLNEFEMPIYSVDREQDLGFPDAARRFSDRIAESDGIVISLAEHNGTYTAAFKNVLDWASRIHAGKLWQEKPMLVLSTSPGGRGGATVLNLALNHWPFMAGDIKANFSLPFFGKNFSAQDGIVDEELKKTLLQAVSSFEVAI